MKKIDIKGRIVGDGFINMFYDYWGVPYASPSKIQKALNDANNDEIEVYINSPGGSVTAGYEIYNILSEYKGNITMKIVGMAASAASFISQVKNAKALMSPLSQMMIHNASSYAEGPHQAMDETSNMLQVTDSTIAQAYVMKSGKAEAEIRKLMEAETYFTPQQALELGLIDGIMDFDAGKTAPTLYNSLPLEDESFMSLLESCKNEDDLKKVMSEHMEKFMESLFKGNDLENSLHISEEPIENIENKEEEIVNAEELKAKYPDACNEIAENAKNSAVEDERKRIASIYALAKPGVEDYIKQGIENGLTAGEVAINILNAQETKGKAALEAAKEDAENSGMNDVDTSKAPANEDDKQGAIDLLANAGKSIMGGKR